VPRLKLLRTSKQICEEASAVFYGANEFRCTNRDGWYVLSAFLRQIGPANQRRLRSIVVHIPWFGRSGDAFLDLGSKPNEIPKWMKQRLIQLGLRPNLRRNPETLEDCVKDCSRTSEFAGHLTSVKLVIPDTHELRTDAFEDSSWSLRRSRQNCSNSQESSIRVSFAGDLQCLLSTFTEDLLMGLFRVRFAERELDILPLSGQRRILQELKDEAWRLWSMMNSASILLGCAGVIGFWM
jgi:hypothetical protein